MSSDIPYSTAWQRKHPEKHRENSRNWRRNNPEKMKEINKRRRENKSIRSQTLQYKYGISLDEKEAMFEAQGRCCAICKSIEPGWKHNWAVDHCHYSNRVRSILCHSCNIVLGRVKESISTLKRMISYIEIHNGSDSDVQS